MNEPKPHKSLPRPMIRLENGGRAEDQADLIVEEPLSIRIDGQPYAVVMRTPGDETSHVAGFCLAEGLIDSPEDIATIGFCAEEGTNVATVTLTPQRRAAVDDLLTRKGFVSQTSCGICGKEVVRDMQQILRPLSAKARFSSDQLMAALDLLASSQELYQSSRGAHAALIIDGHGRLLAFAEDVGRHNALDKAVGRVFLDRSLPAAAMGLMSSRLSYELVQKAARAGLEVLAGFSRPTSLAVDLALTVNMTLICFQDNRLLIFSGPERVV
jgi:FdhD protein